MSGFFRDIAMYSPMFNNRSLRIRFNKFSIIEDDKGM
jgi:hypothetical protein